MSLKYGEGRNNKCFKNKGKIKGFAIYGMLDEEFPQQPGLRKDIIQVTGERPQMGTPRSKGLNSWLKHKVFSGDLSPCRR